MGWSTLFLASFASLRERYVNTRLRSLVAWGPTAEGSAHSFSSFRFRLFRRPIGPKFLWFLASWREAVLNLHSSS
jgi:hypothetical protein